MIRFQCPACATAYSVNDKDAGRKATCGKCHQRVLIPTPRRRTMLGRLLPAGGPPPLPRRDGEDWSVPLEDSAAHGPDYHVLYTAFASLTFAALSLISLFFVIRLFSWVIIVFATLAVMVGVASGIMLLLRHNRWPGASCLIPLGILTMSVILAGFSAWIVFQDTVKAQRNQLPPLHY